MKRLFIILIKLIPIITLYHGASKGHNRLKPLLNLGKVVLSQYEIKNVTDIVVLSYKETQGQLVNQEGLGELIVENYSDQYTSLVRQVITKNISYANDIWNTPFQIDFNRASGQVTVFSRRKGN